MLRQIWAFSEEPIPIAECLLSINQTAGNFLLDIACS